MDVKIEIQPGHVHVVARGEFDAEAAKAGIVAVIGACRRSGVNRVLIDARSITTAVSIMHRYEFAKTLADQAEARVRMAIVVSGENMFSKTLEETALNLGMDVRTTDSMAEGLIYLGLPIDAKP